VTFKADCAINNKMSSATVTTSQQLPAEVNQNHPTPLTPVKKYQDESILVVPADIIRKVAPKTFSSKGAEAIPTVLENYSFLDRNLAEHDENFKQVIPYVLISHNGKFLLIRRTKKQGEARLHDKFSLGIGGHINDVDLAGVTHKHIIEAGMRRELAEEIGIEKEESCELVGIINDNSTEVARVHVGFVYVLKTASPQFTIAEPDKYTAEWKSRQEMEENYPHMESWAQIVFDYVVCQGDSERIKNWETPS
jgi:predicted NUDIX family phosphoesterase